MTKQCFKCGDAKPLDAFYAHPMMADGHLNKCKDCARKDVRQHRVKNPDKVREYDRRRANEPHRVALRGRVHDRELERYPDRIKARNAIGRAVRDGKAKKLPCAFCSNTEGLEAHHHDYSKPLDVTWICRPCHRRFHALERMATYERDAA